MDIGGTAIKSIVMDATGKTIRELALESHAQTGPEQLRAQMRAVVEAHTKEGLKISCVGVGCAGSVDGHQGLVRYSPNFAAGRNLNLKDWVEEDFGLPCVVENDANCAVVAEWKLGKGKGKQNIVLITLGTGVGGGLILNNRLFRGSTGTGGEIGHFSIDANGAPGAHALPGTFELYCSATAIHRESGTHDAKEVFDSYGKDPRCTEIVDKFLHHFQVAVASLANIFDPDMILLGGAMGEGAMRHIEKIRSWVKSHVFSAIGDHLVIDQAQYGNMAGSIGAALLAFVETPSKASN